MGLFWLRGAFSTSRDEGEEREVTTIGLSARVHW
jgi:hypothetical protein